MRAAAEGASAEGAAASSASWEGAAMLHQAADERRRRSGGGMARGHGRGARARPLWRGRPGAALAKPVRVVCSIGGEHGRVTDRQCLRPETQTLKYLPGCQRRRCSGLSASPVCLSHWGTQRGHVARNELSHCAPTIPPHPLRRLFNFPARQQCAQRCCCKVNCDYCVCKHCTRFSHSAPLSELTQRPPAASCANGHAIRGRVKP